MIGRARYYGACRFDRACAGTVEPADLIGRARYCGACRFDRARMEPADLIGRARYYGACRFDRARAGGKDSARETVHCARFVGPARPLGARDFSESEVRQQCLVKSYARKYSTFLQHLHVSMRLPMCVAIVDF